MPTSASGFTQKHPYMRRENNEKRMAEMQKSETPLHA